MRQLLMIALVAACSSTPGAARPDSPPPRPAFTAFVRGTLAADLATSQSRHDELARGGQQAATDAGDLGHHVLLGTGETGRPKDELLALDEWHTAGGATAFYSDPGFQAGFSALFAEPVQPALFERHPDWYTWGGIEPPAGGGPYWVLIVKGHLAKATEAENRAAHDAVARGFEQAARASGDYAHVPHLALDDPRVFFNVDISTSHDGMLAVLGDPAFQQAFGALFDAPPDVQMYRSTEWHQW
jgi:hypothetical protein